MKRLLYIAFHFPPHGGAGVQRSLKFVKYLPSFGIEPTVLTALPGTDRNWSPPDETLTNEIPSAVNVVRTPWPSGPHATRKVMEEQRLELAVRLVAEQKLDAIFVSMSPFSDAAFASQLSARCGIPWIADLRDPWALDEFQVYRTRWHRQQTLALMRRSLRTASLIIMNTPEAASALNRAFPEFADRSTSITNGFDAEDFKPLAGAPRNDFFTIVHAGFLHATAGLRQRRETWQYRLLGRIANGVEILPRSHYYLLQALARWRTEEPESAARVRVQLIGEPRPIDRELVAGSTVADLVKFTGYLAHGESLRLLRSADVLFLPMHKLAKGKRATIVPGKTYEYLASGRPILAPVPHGDARDFLTHAKTGLICEPDAIAAMTAHLRAQFRLWQEGASPARPDFEYINRFERKELARQLAARLHALASPPAPRLGLAKSAPEVG